MVLSYLATERVQRADDLMHVLLLVQVDRLEEVHFVHADALACSEEVVDVLHLLERHLHLVVLHLLAGERVDQPSHEIK